MGNYKYEADFIETMFLLEACIPQRPIARTMFWHKFIDKEYYKLTDANRKKVFEWIQLNPSFDIKNEDCNLFHLRFNPDNQYVVTTLYEGKEEKHFAFKHEELYKTSRTRSIQEKYIVKIEKK